jgi:hypothetical protein
MVDYLVGVILVAAPWIFRFNDVASAKWVAIVVGLLMLGQALMTNYEVGVVPAVPMHLHLMMDSAIGIFLIASPWIFGFSDDGLNAWLPHVVVGIGELAIAAMTIPWPSDETARRRERDLVGAR